MVGARRRRRLKPPLWHWPLEQAQALRPPARPRQARLLFVRERGMVCLVAVVFEYEPESQQKRNSNYLVHWLRAVVRGLCF